MSDEDNLYEPTPVDGTREPGSWVCSAKVKTDGGTESCGQVNPETSSTCSRCGSSK